MTFSQFAATLVLASLSFASHAELVSFDFTANISTISISHGGGTPEMVGSSGLPGALLIGGDRVTGHITYDTAAPERDDPGHYDQVVKSFSYTFVRSGLQYVALGPINNGVVRESYWDDAVIFVTGAYAPDPHTDGWFVMDDPSGTALNGYALPTNLSLADFATHLIVYNWQNGDTRLQVLAEMDSLTRVSAVPEPGQWAMFALGAAVLAGLARRKRCA